MGRNLSPLVQREFANLHKEDVDSRKSAMKALKSHVKDLDSKSIPQFLAQLYETKETGSSCGVYSISLYEILARVHGVNIVPQIDNIMASIIRTLGSSAGSFALHQACSKVIQAIARYGINPTTPEEKKQHIIHSLCKPLTDCLLCSHESLSCGAASSLKALVDSDNWRFGSDELVNELCLKVAGTLEDRSKQTRAHIGLVMALAKHNSLIVEAYSRCLIGAGIHILKAGVEEGNSQKRLSSIHMVNFLMRHLDPRSIFSELPVIMNEMERCQSDPTTYVKGAAFEALQSARKIAMEKGLNCVKDESLMYGQKRNSCGSSGFGLPESQTLDLLEYESFVDSPISGRQSSSCSDQSHWKIENGRVINLSLKDGVFSKMASNPFSMHSRQEYDGAEEECRDRFGGFLQKFPQNDSLLSTTTSIPQRSHPRKHIRSLQGSLQEQNDAISGFSAIHAKGFQIPSVSSNNKPYGNDDVKLNDNIEIFECGSESVSSTNDVPSQDALAKVFHEGKIETARFFAKGRFYYQQICAIVFMLLAVFIYMIWLKDDPETAYPLAPT